MPAEGQRRLQKLRPETTFPPRPTTQPHDGWRTDSVFSASAEAGREFDKLATDLTTPRDSLTREVNLVVSLSRTPPKLRLPAGAMCYAITTGFRNSDNRSRERAAEAFNQPVLTKPSITRNLGLASTHQASNSPSAATQIPTGGGPNLFTVRISGGVEAGVWVRVPAVLAVGLG